MKKLITILLMILSFTGFSQMSSRLNPLNAGTSTVTPYNVLWVDTNQTISPTYFFRYTHVTNFRLPSFNCVIGLQDSLNARYTKTQINNMMSSVGVPTLVITGNNLSCVNGNTIAIDGSTTNELQNLNITQTQLSISNGNTVNLPNVVFTNTVAVAGGAGNAVFYLTDTKAAGGTGLYSGQFIPTPIVNDATTNYTYGWTYNSTTKALTVNVKYAPGLVVGVLTLLGVPVNTPNGTVVNLTVNGQ